MKCRPLRLMGFDVEGGTYYYNTDKLTNAKTI
jgi:hypothetical protein